MGNGADAHMMAVECFLFLYSSALLSQTPVLRQDGGLRATDGNQRQGCTPAQHRVGAGLTSPGSLRNRKSPDLLLYFRNFSLVLI